MSNTVTRTEDHSTRAHAVLSASGVDWWTNCRGAVLATRGMPEQESDYAREGRAAHEVAQDCLLNGRDAVEWIDRTVDGFEVDADFADAVQEYLDECRAYMGSGWVWWIERRISLDLLDPPVDMFGTADFVAYNAELGLLVIIDFKFGRGIQVKVENNGQVRYYALGALLAMPFDMPVRAIRGIIVQPRVPYGKHVAPVDLDIAELVAWSIWLLDVAREVLTPGAPLTPGSWCREKFCKLSGRCAAQAEAALRMAQDEFSIDDIAAPPSFPEPRMLTSAQIQWILDNGPLYDGFVAAVRDLARDGIHRGWLDVPGWTVTPRESRERWVSADEAAIAKRLMQSYGLSADEAWRRKLASPAQARAAIIAGLRTDTKMKKRDAEDMARGMLAGGDNPMVVKESSGVNLVPIAMGRPPAGVRGSEFDLLDAPGPETTRQGDTPT